MTASRTTVSIDNLRATIAGATVAFGIPAFNEGDGILPTLSSLWHSLTSLQLRRSEVILAESHDVESLSSAQPARRWATVVDANLHIDSIGRRRPKKEAINCIFDRAKADVLVLVDADVVIPQDSLAIMLSYLFTAPRPTAVTGAALPDPAASGWKFRAGAWQLRASTRAASRAPRRVDPRSPRILGAFWGCWHTFYSTYRLPMDAGSFAEDVEIARALGSGGHPYLNVPEAFVYVVPPGSPVELCLGTLRSDAALAGRKRGGNEYVAALVEAARDPLGAALYGWGRIWCRRNRSTLLHRGATEDWPILNSTKRRSG